MSKTAQTPGVRGVRVSGSEELDLHLGPSRNAKIEKLLAHYLQEK